MRLFEFADAEAQVALWKVISDSVWAAIQTERQQQALAKSAKAVKKPKSPARKKTAPRVPAKPPASRKQKMQPSKPVEKSKNKSAAQATVPPQMQQMPIKPIANTARSNAVPLNPSSTSSASLPDKNAAVARQSIAQTQRQLYPFANDETVKRLTR